MNKIHHLLAKNKYSCVCWVIYYSAWSLSGFFYLFIYIILFYFFNLITICLSHWSDLSPLMFYASFSRSSQPARAFVISSMKLSVCGVTKFICTTNCYSHFRTIFSVFFIRCTIYTLLTLQSATAITSKHLTHVLYVYIAVISSV